MKEKLLEAIQWLKNQNVDYADIRVGSKQIQNIKIENDNVQKISSEMKNFIGVRVTVDGYQGFSGAVDIDNLMDIAKEALDLAKGATKLSSVGVYINKDKCVVDKFVTKIEKDPFCVPLEEKINLLLECYSEAKRVQELDRMTGEMLFSKEDKIFADTCGSIIEQTIYKSSVEMKVFAKSQNDVQTRCYPSLGGNIKTAGYEYVEELDLVNSTARIANEVAILIKADECPSGVFDIILAPDQLALQIHESIGHATELDRILGYEISLAGGSFVKREYINNNFRYASDCVNIVADPSFEGGCASFGYDDDGVKARKEYIIKDGMLVSATLNIETAPTINQTANGQSVCKDPQNIPMARMTNINLLAGEYTLDELISKVKYGLYLKTNKSWSIDDRRLNFQFGCEMAYEIVDGKLSGKIYKNPVYIGSTPEFWKNCDGIANENYWEMSCAATCGKGIPSQIINVGHGSSPALFRNVKVGV